jgi:uncharacterized protein YecE (DUF72 family)
VARHRVGTSGWSYAPWRGLVYPRKLKQGEWLGYLAGRLNSVEVNASFYRLPRESMLRGWVERTPDDFLFAIKAWRAITHFRRLAECADLLDTFFASIAFLGPKGGPILFQLPPHFAADPPRLEAFLDMLPAGRRHAIEFRDPSWHRDDVYALLEARNVAFCPFELGDLRSPRLATADFVYVRLHGRAGRYRGDYSGAPLRDWAGARGTNGRGPRRLRLFRQHRRARPRRAQRRGAGGVARSLVSAHQSLTATQGRSGDPQSGRVRRAWFNTSTF